MLNLHFDVLCEICSFLTQSTYLNLACLTKEYKKRIAKVARTLKNIVINCEKFNMKKLNSRPKKNMYYSKGVIKLNNCRTLSDWYVFPNVTYIKRIDNKNELCLSRYNGKELDIKELKCEYELLNRDLILLDIVFVNLKTFELSNVEQFTDDHMKYLHNVEVLIINNCKQLTGKYLKNLIHLKKLILKPTSLKIQIQYLQELKIDYIELPEHYCSEKELQHMSAKKIVSVDFVKEYYEELLNFFNIFDRIVLKSISKSRQKFNV